MNARRTSMSVRFNSSNKTLCSIQLVEQESELDQLARTERVCSILLKPRVERSSSGSIQLDGHPSPHQVVLIKTSSSRRSHQVVFINSFSSLSSVHHQVILSSDRNKSIYQVNLSSQSIKSIYQVIVSSHSIKSYYQAIVASIL